MTKKVYRIEGLDKTILSLQDMVDIDKKEIRKVILKEADILVQTVQSKIPVKTGRLKNKYKVIEKGASRFPTTVLVGYDYARDGGGSLTIPALASIIEYGHPAKAFGVRHRRKSDKFKTNKKGERYTQGGIGGKFYTNKMAAAKPAFAPVRTSFDMLKGKIEENVVYGIDQLIGKQAKKKNLKTK